MHRVNLSLHEIFHALSDPYRVRMVGLMLKVKGDVCLCDLSESLEEPEYKLSRHVKVLKSSGLITSVREGKWIYHSLVKDQKYLKAIHQAIRLFPDEEKQMAKDFVRFTKRSVLREKGRCRQPSTVQDKNPDVREKRS